MSRPVHSMAGNAKIFDCRWEGAHGIGRYSAALFARLSGFARIGLGSRPSGASDPFRLAAYLAAVRPKLYLSPGYNAPVVAACPIAFTVHDLNHLFIRENSSSLKRLYYSRILRPAMRRAATVFTVSEFSRQQILEWSGVAEDKVVCVRQGIAEEFRPEGEVYRSCKPFLLYVGNHRPHKNLQRMISAFSASGLSTEFDLLCTGSPNEALVGLVNRLGVHGSLMFLGTVSDRMLASLYRGARAVILVSLYEGFGLPIVESMACGTPVVTSNVASMPEVAGDAAALVNPLDIDSIAHGMRRVARDEDLRSSLRARGLERCMQYNWDSAAATVQMALGRFM